MFGPGRAQRLQAGADADALREHLAADSRYVVLQRVQDAKLQRIDPQPVGQLVKQRFLRNRGLRHAKAAERAGGRAMAVDALRLGPVIGNAIGP